MNRKDPFESTPGSKGTDDSEKKSSHGVEIIANTKALFRRRRKDVGIAEINRSAVVHEESAEHYNRTIKSFEQKLEKKGLDSGRQKAKLKQILAMHAEQYNSAENMDGFDDDFFDLDPFASIEEFEKLGHCKNEEKPPGKRLHHSLIKINAWHQKFTLKRAMELALRPPGLSWMVSFYQLDPRWQIMKFFDEVAREGGEVPMDEQLVASPLPNLFNKASVFTVWRPTSDEAIKNMVLGIATGKGLDIKGKSARHGNISSYVPFIQIYDDRHKEECRTYVRGGNSIRVFYDTAEARNEAREFILGILEKIRKDNPKRRKLFAEPIDAYVNSTKPAFGLDVTERLFWESYVMSQDCSRPSGTEWDIWRTSEPAFMEMNFDALRHAPTPGDPRAVVYQMCKTNPMEPRMLLMAYEEYGGVKPVVSDFDCFTLGSRGVKYKEPLPPEQIELVQWSIDNIREVLDEKTSSGSMKAWTETWIERRKLADGYYPEQPKYGNGDPKSYEIISVAVSRLQTTGCVRHGAECFNWFFPQEMDEQFLVVSDTLPGNKNWMKVNVEELQDLLIEKIDEGFTFPINPKWVLCDPGWRRVYDKLLTSEMPNVQDSINCWLPPETGLREKIDEISKLHPRGFESSGVRTKTSSIILMMNDLEKYMSRETKAEMAYKKLRVILFLQRTIRGSRMIQTRGSGFKSQLWNIVGDEIDGKKA